MRKMILCIIIFPLFAKAQSPESEIAFKNSIPDSLGKPIRLPEPGYYRGFNMEDIADYYIKQRIFIISTDSIYRRIFWDYRFTKDSLQKYGPDKDSLYYKWMVKHRVDSLPVIDFSKQELVMYSSCGQCLAFCEHENGNKSTSCHRNVCNFMYEWFLRDKKYVVTNETGQKRIFLDALYGYSPDSTAKFINLPSAWRTDFHKFFEVGKKSSYLYIVADSLYHKIFSWEFKYYGSSMPVIDFTKQELLVRVVCHQCLMSCNPQGFNWNNTPCHRNVCRYSYTWYLRDKTLTRD